MQNQLLNAQIQPYNSGSVVEVIHV